jgi:hypothetical protein
VIDLRNKARLLVPEGNLLVGVMDEFNVLQEGEVFVQVGVTACSCSVARSVSNSLAGGHGG